MPLASDIWQAVPASVIITDLYWLPVVVKELRNEFHLVKS